MRRLENSVGSGMGRPLIAVWRRLRRRGFAIAKTVEYRRQHQ